MTVSLYCAKAFSYKLSNRDEFFRVFISKIYRDENNCVRDTIAWNIPKILSLILTHLFSMEKSDLIKYVVKYGS